MSPAPLVAGELADFGDAIEREFGHQPDDRRSADLEKLLRSRIAATASPSYRVYRERLKPRSPEWTSLAPLLTVPETYFFRMPGHFDALAEEALPRLIRANRDTRTLRLLSAGCASGEEAYTLRIVLNERFPELRDWNVTILGIDLSEPALDRARAGVYSEWSLRATSPQRRETNFTRAGKQFSLNAAARAGVRFERANLRDEPAPSEPLFDVVFCRNVLIYFSESAITEVVDRLAQRLRPGGYLFLGPAESLRGVSADFCLCQAHETFFYRRRDRGPIAAALASTWRRPHAPTQSKAAANHAAEAHTASELATAPELPANWYNTIRESSERLAWLVEPLQTTPRTARPRQTAQPTTAASASASVRRRPVKAADAWAEGAMALIREERFSDALSLLEAKAPAPEAVERASHAVLRAVTLVSLGRFADAETACRLALAAQSASPGAHFLLGLCDEQAGRLPDAEQQLSTAVLLDPGFSMAYLHLGLVARRRGETEAASAAFGKALHALDGDLPERLLLFGGGFSRESLRDLCRTVAA